jgi:hypothetical protein
MREQLDLFPDLPVNPHLINPMVRTHGPGPAGRTCRDCQHAFVWVPCPSWMRCEGSRNGYVIAVRKTYPACARFNER